MGVAILGVGQVSALGDGVEALRAGLCGERLPAILQQTVETPSGPVALPVYRAPLEGLSRFVQPRAVRRLDRLSRLALLSAHLALEDAGRPPVAPERLGLVFGTGHGPQATTFAFQDGLLELGDRFASPTLFSGSVHNSLASQVSIALQVEGPCQTVTCQGATTAEVLAMARSWLAGGEVDLVLAGVGDELSDPLCYAAACLRDPARPVLAPLELTACSFAPGEGCVCWLLGTEDRAARRGRIESIAVGREVVPPKSAEALFLAAAGDLGSADGYHRLMRQNLSTSAHAALYGSMPAGLAFEIALAALSAGGGPIACAESSPGGQLSCVVVSP
jgi:3-oxoacyl-[acyl-carrier-protein] synthase II